MGLVLILAPLPKVVRGLRPEHSPLLEPVLLPAEGPDVALALVRQGGRVGRGSGSAKSRTSRGGGLRLMNSTASAIDPATWRKPLRHSGAEATELPPSPC